MSPITQPLILLQNATAVSPGFQIPCSGSGGTPPYTYAVLPGGAGGSISSGGTYTAPAAPNPPGLDTITVTDLIGSVARGQVAVGGVLQLVCDIIRNQMGLSQDQVYLYEQKINIPTDSRLYVAVGFLSCKAFSNIRQYDGAGMGFVSNQATNFASQLSIDILSRGPAARDLKEQVLLALNSIYAEQQQEANSFRIFPISNAFVNISEEDGAAILYRFNITVTVQYVVSKSQNVPYFDTFPTPEVLTNS